MASSSLTSSLTIAQPNLDGSIPVPAVPGSAADTDAAAQAQEQAQRLERLEQLEGQLGELQEILARPLADILAERDKFKESSAAWDAFGAMWMLSQRAMRRVAMDLAAQQGLGEEEVIKRALAHANEVLNGGDAVDLGGTIAPAQMAHIARHRPFLRKQFR